MFRKQCYSFHKHPGSLLWSNLPNSSSKEMTADSEEEKKGKIMKLFFPRREIQGTQFAKELTVNFRLWKQHLVRSVNNWERRMISWLTQKVNLSFRQIQNPKSKHSNNPGQHMYLETVFTEILDSGINLWLSTNIKNRIHSELVMIMFFFNINNVSLSWFCRLLFNLPPVEGVSSRTGTPN